MGCATDASLLPWSQGVLDSDEFRWNQEGTTLKRETGISGHLLAHLAILGNHRSAL